MSTLSEPLWRTAERFDILLWLTSQHSAPFGRSHRDYEDLIGLALWARTHAVFGGDRWTCLSSATK